MQTTLTINIDSEDLATAEHLAAERRLSVIEFVSSLTHQSLSAVKPYFTSADGIPTLIVKDKTPVTLEFVNKLREEYGG